MSGTRRERTHSWRAMSAMRRWGAVQSQAMTPSLHVGAKQHDLDGRTNCENTMDHFYQELVCDRWKCESTRHLSRSPESQPSS